MTSKKKLLIITGVSLAVVIIVVVSIVNNISSKTLQLSGILEAEKTEIPALVSGVVQSLSVDEGSEVKKNDVILTLDKSDLMLKRDEALSAVKQAEANLELTKSGASSAQIMQLRAKLNQAKANLQSVQIGSRPEEIAQAQVKYASSQTALDQASKELESAKRLFNEDVISQSKLDDAQMAYNNAKSLLRATQESLKLVKQGATRSQISIAKQQVLEAQGALKQAFEGARPGEVKAAVAQIDKAKAELKLIENSLKNCEIKAPISGTISELSVSQGEILAKGASVATILDVNHLWVKLFVPESKLIYLKLNQKAKINPEAKQDIEIPGKINFISKEGAFVPPGTKESVDQQVFEVKVMLDTTTSNGIQLRPGMTVKVKLELNDLNQ